MPEDNEMAKRIKIGRAAIGLTQQELADRIGVSLMTVLRWEKGTRIPNALLVSKISEALGISTGYLMGLEDMPESQKNIPIRESTKTSTEKNMNMATLILDNGNKVEAPATPEGYAFLKDVFAMSMAGKPVLA